MSRLARWSKIAWTVLSRTVEAAFRLTLTLTMLAFLGLAGDGAGLSLWFRPAPASAPCSRGRSAAASGLRGTAAPARHRLNDAGKNHPRTSLRRRPRCTLSGLWGTSERHRFDGRGSAPRPSARSSPSRWSAVSALILCSEESQRPLVRSRRRAAPRPSRAPCRFRRIVGRSPTLRQRPGSGSRCRPTRSRETCSTNWVRVTRPRRH